MTIGTSDGKNYESEWDMLVQQAGEIDKIPVTGNQNLGRATDELKLNPQEQDLYKHHLNNLWGSGGVDNPDGTRSTVSARDIEQDGKTYIIPSVYEGKILSGPDAINKAFDKGIDSFPSYNSRDEAMSRYDKMHSYFTADTKAYQVNKKLDSVNQDTSSIPISQMMPEEWRQMGFQDLKKAYRDHIGIDEVDQKDNFNDQPTWQQDQRDNDNANLPSKSWLQSEEKGMEDMLPQWNNEGDVWDYEGITHKVGDVVDARPRIINKALEDAKSGKDESNALKNKTINTLNRAFGIDNVIPLVDPRKQK